MVDVRVTGDARTTDILVYALLKRVDVLDPFSRKGGEELATTLTEGLVFREDEQAQRGLVHARLIPTLQCVFVLDTEPDDINDSHLQAIQGDERDRVAEEVAHTRMCVTPHAPMPLRETLGHSGLGERLAEEPASGHMLCVPLCERLIPGQEKSPATRVPSRP